MTDVTQISLAIVIGSLRKESFSRRIANALADMLPASVLARVVEIGDLPLYNPDLDTAAPPAPWVAFRAAIEASDAVLFVTPEHNRSMPAALKNALDVGSRPYGKNKWSGLPGAVISTSTGVLGGFGANHHLRQSLVPLGVPTLQQPEAYIGNAASLLSDGGGFANESTRAFFESFLANFIAWVERHSA